MKKLTLSGKLHLMVLIILIPLFILQITGINRYEGQMLHSELVAEREYTKVTRATYINYLDYLWDFGYSVGTTIVDHGDRSSPEKLEAYLQELVAQMEAYEEFSWVGPDGRIDASTLEKARGVSVSHLEVIQQILQGAERGLSDVIVGEVTEQPVILVARAIRRNGRLVGIFVVSLNPEHLKEILPQGRNNRFKYFGLVDRQGVVVTDQLTQQKEDGVSKLLEVGSPVQQALQGQVVQEARYYSDRDQQTYLTVAIPIPKIQWVVFAASSREEILVRTHKQINRYLFLFSWVMVISLGLAMVLGINFLRPIHALRKTALQIVQGNFSARTQIRGEDELGITGQSFDQMAERIQILQDSRLQFLQTAAHELQNPMFGLKGILSLVKGTAGQATHLANGQQMIKLMEQEINRLSRLLNQILEAFRTQREAQYLAFQWEEVDLLKVITGVIQSFQINDKGVQIHFEPPEIDLAAWVYGDFHRLEEVVRSLIHNAVKFSPAESEVLIRIKKEEQDWLVAIQDQGIGIPQGQLENIFDCFRRADNINEETDPGGVGLGLYICKLIIQRHGGSIWVTSEEGYGSIFYIRIPRFKTKGESR